MPVGAAAGALTGKGELHHQSQRFSEFLILGYGDAKRASMFGDVRYLTDNSKKREAPGCPDIRLGNYSRRCREKARTAFTAVNAGEQAGFVRDIYRGLCRSPELSRPARGNRGQLGNGTELREL
jgi:hypothetical protein